MHETHSDNPFIKGLIIKESRVLSKIGQAPELKIININNNVVNKNVNIVLASERLNDKARFIKVYDATIFYGLTKTQLKIVTYIFESLQYNSDYVFLTHTKFTDYDKKYGDKTTNEKMFDKARSELIVKQIIAKRTRGCYWINPSIFFRGERRRIAYNKI